MISGILNVYKEKGYTSHDVVARLRGIVGQKKIGHTGTLDPEAEGVLPVCLGKATKVCDLLTDKDKVYEAVLLLGTETDTQDMTGTVLRESVVSNSPEEVEEAVLDFIGGYEQVPPMYSALKVNGKKLCDLARDGIEVARKARHVTIYQIEMIQMELPRVRMRVHCSKGTYIRTLCHDIGQRLGCGGCMESLIRVRSAEFTADEAKTIDEIEQYQKRGRIQEILYPIDTVFASLQKGVAKSGYEKVLYNGNRITPDCLIQEPLRGEEQTLRIYDGAGNFIGIYRYDGRQKNYKPVKIFWEQ